MNLTKTAIVLSACTFLSACAATPLESDFGNSVRSMISAQTLNANPQPATAETGDGRRLEGVVGDYRDTVTKRTSVSNSTQMGVE
jgi:starvation-inducible outer membrane lipoprotein